MNLHPKRIFADIPFQRAQSTGHALTVLEMHPKALQALERNLRSAGMLRETGFTRRQSKTGATARYRGVDIVLDNSLSGHLAARYSDGSTHKIPLDRNFRA